MSDMISSSSLIPVFDMLISRLDSIDRTTRELKECQIIYDERLPPGNEIQGFLHCGHDVIVTRHYASTRNDKETLFVAQINGGFDIFLDSPNYCTEEWLTGKTPGVWDAILLKKWGPDKLAEVFACAKNVNVDDDDIMCDQVNIETRGNHELGAHIYELVVREKHKDVVAIDDTLVFRAPRNATIGHLTSIVFDVIKTIGRSELPTDLEFFEVSLEFTNIVAAVCHDRDDIFLDEFSRLSPVNKAHAEHHKLTADKVRNLVRR